MESDDELVTTHRQPNKVDGSEPKEAASRPIPWWRRIAGVVVQLDAALQPARKTLETSALAHFVVIFAGLFTLYQVTVDLEDRRGERQDRLDESFTRALNHIASPLESNSGRGDTLSRLIADGRPLGGLNFYCRTIGLWDSAKERCLSQTAFNGVDTTQRQDLVDGDYVDLPQFDHVILRNSNLSRAAIAGDGEILIEDSNLTASLVSGVRTRIHRSDLTSARVTSHVASNAIASNFTDVEIVDGTYQTHTTLAAKWFWADFPVWMRQRTDSDDFTKVALSKGLVEAYAFDICDPRFRQEAAFSHFLRWIGMASTSALHGQRPTLTQDHTVAGSDYEMVRGEVKQSQTALKVGLSLVPPCPLLTYEQAVEFYPDAYTAP